jgi:hypothetical protein
MISSDFSFERFVEAVRGKDRLDIVELAEKEATEAWRSVYRCGDASDDGRKSRTYQARLLRLIDCIRHSSLTLASTNGRAAERSNAVDGCFSVGPAHTAG